jgi:hypothetical protein
MALRHRVPQEPQVVLVVAVAPAVQVAARFLHQATVAAAVRVALAELVGQVARAVRAMSRSLEVQVPSVAQAVLVDAVAWAAAVVLEELTALAALVATVAVLARAVTVARAVMEIRRTPRVVRVVMAESLELPAMVQSAGVAPSTAPMALRDLHNRCRAATEETVAMSLLP